jgi:hypothetical protein
MGLLLIVTIGAHMDIAYWIAPGLAVAAAVGVTVLQVLALGFHASRGETKDLWLNGVLIFVGGVAAWLAVATS